MCKVDIKMDIFTKLCSILMSCVIVICQVTIYATLAMQYTIYTEWTTELPTCWLLNVEVTGVSQHNTQLISSQQPSHHRHNTPTDWTHSLSAHRELQCHCPCSGACRSTSPDQATSTCTCWWILAFISILFPYYPIVIVDLINFSLISWDFITSLVCLCL